MSLGTASISTLSCARRSKPDSNPGATSFVAPGRHRRLDQERDLMKIAIVCLALFLSIHVAFRAADQPQQIAFAEVHAGDTLPSLPLRSG